MVITAGETTGEGWSFNQKDQEGTFQSVLDFLNEVLTRKDKETKIEELDVPTTKEFEEQITNLLDQVKPFVPYLAALGSWKLFTLVKDGKIKINWDGFAGGAIAFAPIITAIAWYLFTKINTTAKVLSFGIAGAEVIPTIDLNLPQGINLGAFFSVGDVVLLDIMGGIMSRLSEEKGKYENLFGELNKFAEGLLNGEQ